MVKKWYKCIFNFSNQSSRNFSLCISKRQVYIFFYNLHIHFIKKKNIYPFLFRDSVNQRWSIFYRYFETRFFEFWFRCWYSDFAGENHRVAEEKDVRQGPPESVNPWWSTWVSFILALLKVNLDNALQSVPPSYSSISRTRMRNIRTLHFVFLVRSMKTGE